MKVWDYDEFADKYGFQPLDQLDITYHAINESQTLRGLVDTACNNDQFVSVHDWGDSLEVSLGWGSVDVLHRCFIPDGVTL